MDDSVHKTLSSDGIKVRFLVDPVGAASLSVSIRNFRPGDELPLQITVSPMPDDMAEIE